MSNPKVQGQTYKHKRNGLPKSTGLIKKKILGLNMQVQKCTFAQGSTPFIKRILVIELEFMN